MGNTCNCTRLRPSQFECPPDYNPAQFTPSSQNTCALLAVVLAVHYRGDEGGQRRKSMREFHTPLGKIDEEEDASTRSRAPVLQPPSSMPGQPRTPMLVSGTLD